MSDASKIKCPRCSRFVLKKVILATHGKCNNCGYMIAGAITDFAAKPKAVFDISGEITF